MKMTIYMNQGQPPKTDLANAIRPLALLKEDTGEKKEVIKLWKEARELYAEINLKESIAECSEHLVELGAESAKQQLKYIKTKEQPAEVPLDPKILNRYVGEYVLNPNFSVAISLEEGTLFAKATGEVKTPICAESETNLFLQEDDPTFSFQLSKDDVVKSLTLHACGIDMQAKKFVN